MVVKTIRQYPVSFIVFWVILLPAIAGLAKWETAKRQPLFQHTRKESERKATTYGCCKQAPARAPFIIDNKVSGKTMDVAGILRNSL